MYKRQNTSLIDLLFTLLLVFVVMVALLLMLPKKPEEAAGNITPKAKYTILLDWSEKRDTDVDLWLGLPDSKGNPDLVFFKRKRGSGASLERDDQGNKADRIGRTPIKSNQELLFIRSANPGEYIVNVHIYSSLAKISKAEPLPVRVTILQMEPFKVVYQAEKIFTDRNEEQTYYRFILDEEGQIVETSEEFVSIVSKGLLRHDTN